MLHIFEPILSNSKESGEQHTRQQPQPAARWHSEPRRAPQLRERLGGRLVSRNIRLAMRRIGTRLRNTKRQVRAVCRVAGVCLAKPGLTVSAGELGIILQRISLRLDAVLLDFVRARDTLEGNFMLGTCGLDV